LDKGADAEGEESDRKDGGGGLGVDGKGPFRSAVEGGGEPQEGSGGAQQGQQDDQQGGVHDVFAEIFPLAEEAENEEDDPEVAGDQGGFVSGPGQEKGCQTQGHIQKREDDGDFWHGFVTSRPPPH